MLKLTLKFCGLLLLSLQFEKYAEDQAKNTAARKVLADLDAEFGTYHYGFTM